MRITTVIGKNLTIDLFLMENINFLFENRFFFEKHLNDMYAHCNGTTEVFQTYVILKVYFNGNLFLL